MPVQIEGVEYLSSAEIARDIGVSRQTLWRWRQYGKVPVGQRFRDGKILFTPTEANAIRRFANHIEPIEAPEQEHPSLFDPKP